jgi:hypothetical protein
MKRGLIALIFVLLLSLSFVSATPSFDITKKPVNRIIVRELSIPAVYDLAIKNNGEGDVFSIGTLLDVLIYPKETFTLGTDETKTVTVKLFPRPSEKNRYYGDWSFNYFIKGDSTGMFYDNIMIRILTLKDVISVNTPASINSKDSAFSFTVMNNENLTLDMKMTVDSTLIGYTDNFTLLPMESKEISVPTDSEKLSKEAGTYNLLITFLVNNEAELKVTKDLILESDTRTNLDVSTQSSTFSEKTTFKKSNVGNTPVIADLSANRTILQSMITTLSVKPDSVSREGGNYIYGWSRKLNPGESYTVVMTTNYALPWIILLIIIACYLIVRQAIKKPIKIKKKAYRVKTNTGQFAAKVVLIIKNTGKDVSNAKIIEPLPAFTELLQDRFGTIKPSEVKKHSVIWDFPVIAAKEELILSYIVFSKVSVLGNIEVAPTISTYETGKGIMKESKSNKIFILTAEKQPEPHVQLVK